MSSSLLLSAASGATLAAGSVGLPALVATYWSRALSSSSAASRAAGGGGAAAAGTSPGQPDAFTAALQQKTEEELRLLALKQGQPHTAAEPAEQQQQEADGAEEELPEHGKREFGGYSGPEPTRYKDWEIKGRCSDF